MTNKNKRTAGGSAADKLKHSLSNKALAAASVHRDAQEAFADERSAEGELVAAVLSAVGPAARSLCGPPSAWEGKMPDDYGAGDIDLCMHVTGPRGSVPLMKLDPGPLVASSLWLGVDDARPNGYFFVIRKLLETTQIENAFNEPVERQDWVWRAVQVEPGEVAQAFDLWEVVDAMSDRLEAAATGGLTKRAEDARARAASLRAVAVLANAATPRKRKKGKP